jgi:small subunit ribosomal protein S1
MMTDSERYSADSDSFDGNGAENHSEQSDSHLFEQYLQEEEGFELPERGDLREGTIVEIRSSEILVNIGAKRDGIVPQSDLNRLPPGYVDDLHEGQVVPVVVSKSNNDEGILILSISDALQQQDWLTAEHMLESGEISIRKIVSYNKGGLLVEFGHLRGFIPASHIVGLPRNLDEEQRFEEFAQRVGEEVPVKVIEVDRRRRRLVLSHRLAEREYRAERKAELFRRLHVGDVVEGEVRSLRPFGAFVDIGGADGLLHVSEIGWTPVSHPRDVLNVGDKIQVEILRLDPERNRIALSRKRLLPNPWESIEERYKAGDTVLATITRVVDFGAFARLEPGVEGLIHVSELADISVAEPLKTVKPGDRVAVKILRVDPNRQRIGLSIRQADPVAAANLFAAEKGELAEASEESAEEITEGEPEAVVPVEETAPAPTEAVETEAVETEAVEELETDTAPEAQVDASPADNGVVDEVEMGADEKLAEAAEVVDETGVEAGESGGTPSESLPESVHSRGSDGAVKDEE